MKAAILQCDDVLEKFQAEFGNYPAMIENMFAGINPPIEFDTYDCQKGEYPTELDAYDFFITTGSKASVYDGIPWVDELIRYIKTLDKAQKNLIGICFGHELIAVARGFPVKKSDKGWGIGIAQNKMHTYPEWMDEKPKQLNLLVSHQDQILDLPKDAEVMAGSEFCPYFMIQWDNHLFSFQGHPEWSSKYSHTLMNDRCAIIPAETIKHGMNSLSTPPDNALVAKWIIDFVRSA